jgi:hypothetical protein
MKGRWLTLAILATQEAESRRIGVQLEASPGRDQEIMRLVGKKFEKTPPTPISTNGWAFWCKPVMQATLAEV